MKGGMNTALGWVLMLAVLAVPSFLFYNWWAKNRLPPAVEAPAAESQTAFPAQEAQAAEQARQPEKPALPEAELKPAPEPRPEAELKPAPQPRPEAELKPGPLPAEAPAPEAKPAAAQSEAKPAQQAKASGYSPRTDRNPMLSREEYRRIKAEQEARAAEERAARMGAVRKPAERAIETRIALQGIVGNAAIINGDMYAVGQSIYGGKILKVGADYVVIEHRGKKFTKRLQ